MKINAVIIDDELNNIDNLLSLLKRHCPSVEVVATAGNAGEGAAVISQYQPDLVFLDIQMPGKNGFDMLQSLPACNFEIIFVTAFDQYGIQAVKFAAIDYLLKPIDVEELVVAVNKVMEKQYQKKQNGQLEGLLQYLQNIHKKEEHRVALPAAKEIRFVFTKDIIRCESNSNYTTFYLQNGEKLVVSKPILEYEELLGDYGFVRCHQSHLVNQRYIKSYIKEDGGHLLLDDNTQVPVSRQKKDMVKAMLPK